MRRKGGPEGGVALLQAAKAAERDAAAHRPSAAQKQQQIAELEERAVVFGDPVKQSAQAKVLERKWLRFLLVHGEAFKFDARVGPTVELVKHFVAYAFCTRDTVSAIGREGLGDSFELQIRYMLAKFVFVALTYNGWTGLDAHELHVKADIKFHRRKRPSVGGRSARDPAGAAASKFWCCICLGCALCCKQVIGRRSKARRSDPTRFGRLCTRERAIRASRAPRPDTILNHGLASEPWLACTANLHAHHFGDLGGELVGLHKHADVGHAPASISH